MVGGPLPFRRRDRAVGPSLLRRAIAFFERHGVRVERVLTDNGGATRRRRRSATCPAEHARGMAEAESCRAGRAGRSASAAPLGATVS
jgi:hypothetical protein